MIDEVGGDQSIMDESNFEHYMMNAKESFEKEELEKKEIIDKENQEVSQKMKKLEADKEKALIKIAAKARQELEDSKTTSQAITENIDLSRNLENLSVEIRTLKDSQEKEIDSINRKNQNELKATLLEEKERNRNDYAKESVSNISKKIEFLFKALTSVVLAYMFFNLSFNVKFFILISFKNTF